MKRVPAVLAACGCVGLSCILGWSLLPGEPEHADVPEKAVSPQIPVERAALDVLSRETPAAIQPKEQPVVQEAAPAEAQDGPTSEAENFEVSGVAVDEKGNAVPETKVHASRDDLGDGPSATADEQGRFGLHLQPGAWMLWATNGQWEQSDAIEFTAPAKNLRLVLPSSWIARRMGPHPNNPSYAQRRDTMERFRDTLFEAMQNNEGSKFPGLASKYGAFSPELTTVEGAPGGPEFAEAASRLVYFGYALPDEAAAEVFLDAYEANGPQGLGGEDLEIDPSEVDQVGNSHLYRLRNGIERFFITDINDPYGGQRVMSSVPVCWELPSRGDSGGWVMYLDGHVEWRSYPDEFPLTETLTNRVRGIMASGHRK